MSPSSESPEFATLSEGLDRQVGAMNALRQCLEEEHRALQLRDPEQLLAAIERKNNCIAEADRLERVCREPRPADANHDHAEEKKREQLDTLARMCRDLNDANGSLIRRQQLRVETTLQILRGAPERPGVYGPSGESDRKGAARKVLASA